MTYRSKAIKSPKKYDHWRIVTKMRHHVIGHDLLVHHNRQWQSFMNYRDRSSSVKALERLVISDGPTPIERATNYHDYSHDYSIRNSCFFLIFPCFEVH